jgi:hypothetical protein
LEEVLSDKEKTIPLRESSPTGHFKVERVQVDRSQPTGHLKPISQPATGQGGSGQANGGSANAAESKSKSK